MILNFEQGCILSQKVPDSQYFFKVRCLNYTNCELLLYIFANDIIVYKCFYSYNALLIYTASSRKPLTVSILVLGNSDLCK